MINQIAMNTVGSVAKKAQTLTLWDVVKLVLMIIQMKLLYVTFQAQYYMAVMAAQAPMMMANPMSMFGFNPMNYSSALENAGFPAKRFSQTKNDN